MPGIGDRMFRAVLRLLPREFREQHGHEIEATFRLERRDTESKLGIVRLWATTIVDVLRTAPGEHLDILRNDLRFAARMLMRRPMLTLTATITLALGIGANTAIFSVVNGVLLAPLPYPDADRLVLVEEESADDEPGTTGYTSFDRLREQQTTFQSIAAIGGWSATLTGGGREPERVSGVRVTWEYFRTLGLTPVAGRDFDRQDDHPDRRRQLILSDALWRRRFNADPTVVGQSITVNGVTYSVVGIMSGAVRDIVSERLYPGTEVWTLLGYSPELPQACTSCRHLRVIGRLAPDLGIREAAADLTRIYGALAADFPRDFSQPSAVLTPVRQFFLGPLRGPLLMLWAAVGLLLLITCANMGNLMLIRASERAEEITIRRALGVSPQRLVRQLLTESLALALLGGGAGLLLAAWATPLLASHGPEAIPRLADVDVDARVLGYAIGMSVLTAMAFGMAPARMLIRQAYIHRRTTSTPAVWRVRGALVAVNVALSTLLLVGSGLLVRSFLYLGAVEPGFDPRHVLTMRVDLAGQRYNEPAAVTRFYDELVTRVRALPGVVSAGGSTQLPLAEGYDRWGITVEGRAPALTHAELEADRYGVTPGYFSTMGIPLLRGRLLMESDRAGTPPVVVISKTMADELWPGEDPLGRRVTLAGGPNNPPRTIVGIVGDVRHYGLHLPATMQAYMPRVQSPWLESSMTIVVRVDDGVDPLSLAAPAREQVRAIDALQPVNEIETYEAIVSKSIATRRFTLGLLGLFAVLALTLAIVGLYGALSYIVSQRQREIGIRVALGAVRADIGRHIVAQGMQPVVLGLLSGLAFALVVSRVMQSMLFGVTPNDAGTFAVVSVVICGSALGACLLPAMRAAKIDPAVTLRAE